MSERIDLHEISFDGEALRLRPRPYDVKSYRGAVGCLAFLAVIAAILLVWAVSLPWWLGLVVAFVLPASYVTRHHIWRLRSRSGSDELVLDLRSRTLIVPWFASGRRGKIPRAEIDRIIGEWQANGRWWSLRIYLADKPTTPASKIPMDFSVDTWTKCKPDGLLRSALEHCELRYEEDRSRD